MEKRCTGCDLVFQECDKRHWCRIQLLHPQFWPNLAEHRKHCSFCQSDPDVQLAERFASMQINEKPNKKQVEETTHCFDKLWKEAKEDASKAKCVVCSTFHETADSAMRCLDKVLQEVKEKERKKTMKLKEVMFEANAEVKQFHHVKVGATATVQEGEDPSDVLDQLKRWVAQELAICKRGDAPAVVKGKFLDYLKNEVER